jgi:nitrite reductase/ring-hydroxylating ferredoxin subunit
MTRWPGMRRELRQRGVVTLDTDDGPYLARLVDGRPVVHRALCPHRGGPLSDAYVVGELLICAWHRSVFRADDGEVVHGPAYCALPLLPARFDGADLLIGVEAEGPR